MMNQASPVELTVFASSIVGVGFTIYSLRLVYAKRDALIAERKNGLRMAYAQMRIRQEFVRFLSQCAFFTASVAAIAIPPAPHPRPDHQLAGFLLLTALVCAEWTVLANSILDVIGRHNLTRLIDTYEEERERHASDQRNQDATVGRGRSTRRN